MSEILTRSIRETTPEGLAGLEEFLKACQEGYCEEDFSNSAMCGRLAEIGTNLTEGLFEKAELILMGIHKLIHLRTSLQELPRVLRSDAGIVQGWVESLISGEEMRRMAEAIFPDWQRRLEEAPKFVPHIAQANKWMAGMVVEKLGAGTETTLTYVDLGIGTGGTYNTVTEALREAGKEVAGIGVELTPELAERARKLTDATIVKDDMLEYLRGQDDNSVDLITIGYAAHHLPSADQAELIGLAYCVLKDGGILALSDPTGRSDYNLEVLLINEPEGIFASFVPTVEGRVVQFRNAGFLVNQSGILNDVPILDEDNTCVANATSKGDVLHQGLLGYALIGTKI